MTTSRLFTTLFLILGMTSTVAMAASTRTLSESYQYDGQEVSLDMGIGSAKFIATDSNEIKIEVVVEDSDTNWLFFWGDTDLSDIAIESKITTKALNLSLNEQDNIEQQWTVYLPKQTALSLEVGVGAIEVSGMTNDIEISLGVGSAVVEHQITYNSIDLDSGVGDVSISEQGRKLTVERSLVAQSYSNKDQAGEASLTVDVGVGEVVVTKL
ncbi:hypothetical protein [Shewanella kaireitica]|uniref:hypothetical protein n=1 Tax=Shewanella kaireitica TaxID=212021 RepID=UPI00200EFB5A|nr:hypothetical protein [Shewanella kaireitica]MCL1092650.1 hypothetical protein [Shewanella kaireitica]